MSSNLTKLVQKLWNYCNILWQSLMRLDGDELETHYRHVLESLGKQKGMLGSPLVHLENPPEGRKIGVGVR